MKRRAMRLLPLLWLGWYLSGPLFETVDSWDSPPEEIGDITRSAGGTTTLVAAVICFGIVLFRRWRERCLHLAEIVTLRFCPLTFEPLIFLPLTAPAPTNSPPSPLRI